MRISTSQIFDNGALGIQRNQQGLFKLQNQLSTGRRVLTPEDDPVAAAQALLVTQSKEINAQHAETQSYAQSQLGVLDTHLGSLGDMLQAIREQAVVATNAGYTDNQRGFVASALQQQFDEMISMANSDDGTGQFLFSGYQGNTRPFAINGSGTVVPPAIKPPVVYNGDNGERLLQVGSSRQMASNVSGAEVFMNILAGNGTFATTVGGPGGAGGANAGSALVDAGSVSNPNLWSAAVNAHGSFRVEFSNGGSGLEYQIYNAANVAMLAAPQVYTSHQAIPLQKTTAPAADFGAQIMVTGTPIAGDSFRVQPSTSQSLFKTIQNLIGAIQTPVNATYSVTELKNRIQTEITNLDRAMDNLGRIRADVGSRQKELDFLTSGTQDLQLQYETTLSELQDLDFTKAISQFTQQQTLLEAAQKSFAQISRLSLFNIL